MTRPTLLVSNAHQYKTGGGTYVMMILNILKNHFTIFIQGNIAYYSDPETP
jgi:hypothetical protein